MRSGYFSNSLEALASALAIAAGVTLFAGTAEAQANPTPAGQGAPSGMVETVVVTAERRSTDIQTTPISATVLSAADLANKGVNTIEGLQFATPALTYNNFGQGNEFNIRGLGKGENNIQAPSGVDTFLDGLPISGTFLEDFPFNDVANIDVLRGPQGTINGENATAGAVAITTRNPDFDGFSGFAEANVGNYADAGIKTGVNMPITDDLAMRVALLGERRDSFWTLTGVHTGNPGSLLQDGVQIGFLWQPIPHLEVLLKGYQSYVDRGGYPGDPATLGCSGTVGRIVCTPNPENLFDVPNNVNNESIEQDWKSLLDVKYTFGDGIALRSISGYQQAALTEEYDLDPGTVGDEFNDHGQIKDLSEELNLLSPSGERLTWILGAFFLHEHVDLPGNNASLGGNGFNICELSCFVQESITYHTPKQHEAVFGQFSYDITPKLQFQFGARYNYSYFDENDDEVVYEGGVLAANYVVPCPAVLPAKTICRNYDRESDAALTGKIDLNYKVDDDNFLYAFVATGHKDGAINTAANQPGEIKPENVTDYEGGWKSNFFDGHMRTQLDGFYDNYKDFQVTLTDPTNNTNPVANAPTATIWGIEAQGQAVFGALSFDASAAYIHGAYGGFYAIDARFFKANGTCAYGSGGTATDCQNLTGNQMVLSPHWTANMGAQYVFALGNGDTLTPRVDYSFIDKQWNSVFEVPVLDQLGSRSIVNAQLSYGMQSNWVVSAYATNLTDQHYIAAFDAGVLTSPNIRNAGPPRQFGIRVTKDF
jgi:iron complex outermembrane recepter protein